MPLLAEMLTPTIWHPDNMAGALFATAAFGIIGVVILAFGFKLFEWITPRVDLETELSKGNMAVGAVVAALILGLSWIIVRSMS
jgi:putative membrane protein